jgi:hypothetical protein
MTARTSQIVLIFSAFLTGLVIFSGVFLYATGNFGGGGPAASAIGGPFKLTDQDGNPLTDVDLKGRPFLVFSTSPRSCARWAKTPTEPELCLSPLIRNATRRP